MLLTLRAPSVSVLYISEKPANGVQERPASNFEAKQVVALTVTDELPTTRPQTFVLWSNVYFRQGNGIG